MSEKGSSSAIAEEFIAQSAWQMGLSLDRIEKCLAELTDEEVWQRPNESSNSVGNLVLHLCGNITQWIVAGLGGHRDERERDAEFAAREGHSAADLGKKIRAVTEAAIAVLNRLGPDELLRRRLVQGFGMSGIGMIVHVVEHFSYHTGQITYWTKFLKDRDMGYYADQNLNAHNAQ